MDSTSYWLSYNWKILRFICSVTPWKYFPELNTSMPFKKSYCVCPFFCLMRLLSEFSWEIINQILHWCVHIAIFFCTFLISKNHLFLTIFMEKLLSILKLVIGLIFAVGAVSTCMLSFPCYSTCCSC